MSTVQIYDTTLRDGTQGEGISLSVEDKLKIARKLDELGAHYIEGGWPGSNPKDADFFARARSLPFKRATVTAFGSTRRADVSCEADPQIRMLLAAGTRTVTIVGKTWDWQVRHILGTTPDENLRMIADTVLYLKSQGREVFYDAEHFFDGYKADPSYALATVRAAQDAGADCVVLCDTNGGTLTWELQAIVEVTRKAMTVPLGIHTHDDAGLAVANALAAVRAGCTQVQGTINGYGERVGNANLCSVIPNLKLKMRVDCIGDEELCKLTETSRYVSAVANQAHDRRLPYVGASAFAHKGGLHVAAILKAEESYQHIDPAQVGNEKRVLVSELSGRSNLVYKARKFGLDSSKGEVKAALAQIKELEHRGFHFEGADASIELLLRRAQPSYQPPFELVDFMVIVEHRRGRGIFAEANVKVRVGSEIIHTATEGNGPVNALDAALRKALLPHYPQLATVQLTDYKVRILNGQAATAATTHVMIETRNGYRCWSTIGCSTNIIESSWQALADSLEYALTMTGIGNNTNG